MTCNCGSCDGMAGGGAASHAITSPIHIKHCHSERSEESV